ncbi:MAG: excinuclease ABC subunit C, partial [Gammaproteobacteria bacterium]
MTSAGFDAREFLKTVPDKPGVYLMYGAEDISLYVGKAINLKKRLGSYFRNRGLAIKTQVLVSKIERVEIQIVRSENEALLLEYNLIQELKPRYNIMMRDDKSYPYIRLTEGPYSRLVFYRGSTNKPGKFFGPYASAGAVRETINQIHKVIPLRQCPESVFKNRSRPCLQYQISRCTAPCVDKISSQDYQQDIEQAQMLLSGQDQRLGELLNESMQSASDQLEFEQAVKYRDRIRQLRKVQSGQFVASMDGDVDVLALAREEGQFCIALLTIRNGHNVGQQYFVNTCPADFSEPAIMSAFISQHYVRKPAPSEIITRYAIRDVAILTTALSGLAGRKVILKSEVRGKRDRWREAAELNAKQKLLSHLADRGLNDDRVASLVEFLQMDRIPERIECFDVSHTMGENTVASCVVFDQDGPVKQEYRRFNIRADTGGDDYAAMAEALERRYGRVVKGEGRAPDLLLIDGGKGQRGQAERVLGELGLADVLIVGVAKGLERRGGQERLFLSQSGAPIILDPSSGASHLIQAVRDEAHRFAITGHRNRRQKARTVSRLEQIAGI